MVMRVTGLASGIDSDQIIRDLMKANRIPLDLLKQKKQLVEWQREAYKEINAKILDFRNNKLFEFKKEGVLGAKAATASDSSITVKATGNATEGTFTIETTSLATGSTNQSTEPVALNNKADPNKPLSSQVPADFDLAANNKFTINGTEITIESGDTMNTIIAKINKQTNVTAFYDTHTGQLSLTSKETGLVNEGNGGKTISTSGAFMSEVLKIDDANATEAANAIVKINGIDTERTSNTFDVNGISVTLNEANVGSPATITVKTDTDAIMNTIKDFISAYNELHAELDSKLSENKYKDYKPLTEEEREALSEDEIKRWEEMAKSGLLRKDPILERTFSQFRSAIMSVVADTGSDDYKTLSSIGITTGSYIEKGKLYLSDEAKLREAIETDPEAVMKIFTADGNGDDNDSDVGVMEKLYKTLDGTLKDIAEKAGTSAFGDVSGFKITAVLSKQIEDYEKQIDRMTDKLTGIEDRYYRQFTAMEMAIQRYNEQSAFLMNQFQ